MTDKTKIQEFEAHPGLASIIEWFANNVPLPGTKWNELLHQINNALTKPTPSPSGSLEDAAKDRADDRTQLKIGRLEINCFDEDSEMSLRIGNSKYESLTMNEVKELSNFIASHIKNEEGAANFPSEQIAIEQKAQKYADEVCPFVWPTNKEGEKIEQRVGQQPPGSGKHRREQEKLKSAFIAGAQYNASLPGSQEPWKSVEKDGYPEYNRGLLVFIPDEDYHITSGMWDVSNKWVLLDEYRVPECPVTHYMLLPAVPKEFQKEVSENDIVMEHLTKLLKAGAIKK